MFHEKRINKMQENKNQKIGMFGEAIGVRFLKERGFKIMDRNYRKKWGEIDIVARETNKIHFLEVKSVLCEVKNSEIILQSSFEPEDSIQNWKIERLKRAIQSYLLEKRISDSELWQFDILGVFIDLEKKISKVRFTQGVVL